MVETAMAIGNIGIGNTSTLATFNFWYNTPSKRPNRMSASENQIVVYQPDVSCADLSDKVNGVLS